MAQSVTFVKVQSWRTSATAGSTALRLQLPCKKKGQFPSHQRLVHAIKHLTLKTLTSSTFKTLSQKRQASHPLSVNTTSRGRRKNRAKTLRFGLKNPHYYVSCLNIRQKNTLWIPFENSNRNPPQKATSVSKTPVSLRRQTTLPRFVCFHRISVTSP